MTEKEENKKTNNNINLFLSYRFVHINNNNYLNTLILELNKIKKVVLHQTKQSRMKKFKKTFAITKQNVLEKTSSRENTLEPEQMKELEKQVQESRFYLRKLTKAIEKETVSTGVSIQDGTELADSFIDYSVHVRDNYQDLVILSGILSKIGEFQAGFEDLKAKLNSSLVNDVSDPLKKMVKTELKQAQESKREYDKVRVAYDASLSDLNNLKKNKSVKPTKITEQEQECDTLKKDFELIGIDTSTQLNDTNIIAEFETVEKLCDYLDTYHTFFQKGYRWLAQMIPDIYEYRLYVEKRKAELEKSKVRMSMLLSPAKSGDALKQKVFGEDLSVLITRDQTSIPIFVAKAFQVIRGRIEEEGLFRMSGPKKEVVEYKLMIDDGKDYNLANTFDVHVVCNLVKLFLRELQPEPLLTYSRYNEFIDVCNIESPDERINKVSRIIHSLPKHNFNLLHHLIHLLNQISLNPKNKMGPANLATVVGPNILVSQTDIVVEDIALGNMVITTIIQNFEKIFGGPPVFEPIPVTNKLSTSASSSNMTKSPSFNNNHPSPAAKKAPPVSPRNYDEDSTSPAVYQGHMMRNRNLTSSGSTLGDSFDEGDAVELTDDE
ncbi:RhoGAP domain-containing protein [Heterostelium album PN500]|uniref:RhoGAP domain-containing protein n=1 Tax=Heterostelium pallidum (strain ATCC 26659 / Pp 5 / PN500) TaxID=670386 RepID=D3B013_HETP5|nr:RhoGAP domain-containing protein [Heterostelium album PN500]EFA84637.1 RhoGAP domain-containing protein [Heterostelium album PN500]|eukprot:XP_020436750.1 RhoGAP domain-containing protein [Heterostelium album PN500]